VSTCATNDSSLLANQVTFCPSVVVSSHSENDLDGLCTCPICEERILDDSSTSKGHDAIFCDSMCKKWLHRQCAGLSKSSFAVVSKSNLPFACPRCSLSTLKDELAAMKATVGVLTSDIAMLKSKLEHIEQKLETPVINPSSASTKSNSTCRSTEPNDIPSQSLSHTVDNRKFNIILSGIPECPPGSSRNERSKCDLESVTNILTNADSNFNPLSISDHFRLGKYHTDHSRPRPILIKLIRSSDARLLLSNWRSIPSQYKIKPDLSPEDRAIRGVLFAEKQSLVASGTDVHQIKLSRNTIFISGRLHGKVINNIFVKHPILGEHSPDLVNLGNTNSDNGNILPTDSNITVSDHIQSSHTVSLDSSSLISDSASSKVASVTVHSPTCISSNKASSPVTVPHTAVPTNSR
jgi:hypothetical protein